MKITIEINCGEKTCEKCRFRDMEYLYEHRTQHCELFHKDLRAINEDQVLRCNECIAACKAQESPEEKKQARIANVERKFGKLPEWVRGTYRVARLIGVSQATALNYGRKGIIKAHKNEEGIWEFWKDDIKKCAMENIDRIVGSNFYYRIYGE